MLPSGKRKASKQVESADRDNKKAKQYSLWEADPKGFTTVMPHISATTEKLDNPLILDWSKPAVINCQMLEFLDDPVIVSSADSILKKLAKI